MCKVHYVIISLRIILNVFMSNERIKYNNNYKWFCYTFVEQLSYLTVDIPKWHHHH